MKVIKAKYPNGEPLYAAFPTSAKEVKVIFLMHGIQAWPIKFAGQWSIIYGCDDNERPVIYNTELRRICDCTCKQWLEIALKNKPSNSEISQNPYGEEFCGFFGWPNIKQYIQKET